MTVPSLASEEAELKLAKLRLEIEQLKRAQTPKPDRMRALAIVGGMVPVLALVFAVIQFSHQQSAANQEMRRRGIADSLANERHFMEPILARQQALYFDVSGAAATLASETDPKLRAAAASTFWRLFWGPLVMLEAPDVSKAMKAFGACLEGQGCPADSLKGLSLELASALQTDLMTSWKLSPTEYADRSINYAKLRGGK